jgi:hypothetical protein
VGALPFKYTESIGSEASELNCTDLNKPAKMNTLYEYTESDPFEMLEK